MTPLVSILWSLARIAVAMSFSWLVAKGWITSEQAQKASPELVSLLVLGVIAFATALHAQWQKYRAGLLVNKSPAPSPTQTITVLPPQT